MRRWNGWGDETYDKTLPASAEGFLTSRLGQVSPPPGATLQGACGAVPASRIEPANGLDRSAEARLRHAHGHSFADWAALRYGRAGPFPDAVARPANHEQTRAVVDAAHKQGAVLIAHGGGTSVVGHLRVVDDGRPVISVSMARNTQLIKLDTHNRIARIGAGASGPVLEAQLRAQGYMLGHYPQSFEYSTLGGWIVTRSAGQQSRRYGRIDGMLHRARLACAQTDFNAGGQVASSAGPDMRALVLGSEGRLGLVTEADMMVAPVPEREAFHGVFFAQWERALEAAREIAQAGIDISMLRLSNPEETDTQLRLAGHESAVGWLRRYLDLRGLADAPCLMMLGVTGTRAQTRRARADALAIARRHGGVHAGKRLGRMWAKNRFAGAYLRNALWDAGYAVDTMETAVAWSRVTQTVEAMQQAARTALAGYAEQALAFTHVSHIYTAGASVYMTVIWRLAGDYATDIGRWRTLKHAVSQTVVTAGGTISHQHGVGRDHAPYLAAEKEAPGMRLIAAALEELDPRAMMNPYKLSGVSDVA